MRSAFHMVDVGGKRATRRVAVAQGTIHLGATAFGMIRDRTLPKGDALILAEIAGIQGAKRAADMIPLCHPLPLERVEVRHTLDDAREEVTVYCLAATCAKTGVEMEAMAGVQAALLTLYDLAKMVEPALTLRDSFLLAKSGGKNGLWLCPRGVPDWVLKEMGVAPAAPSLAGVRAAVITLSDRAAAGEYEDKSGAFLCACVREAGAEIVETLLLPDEGARLRAAILDLLARPDKPQLILTTGGTGLAPRDVTPETLRALGGREVPGLGEYLRQSGAAFTPNAWSSRSLALERDGALVIALPGSVKAVREGMEALRPLLPHLLETIAGKKHDPLR